MGYKYQFTHTPYVLRAKVTRAGSLPLPELPPYPLHIIVVVGGWWLVVGGWWLWLVVVVVVLVVVVVGGCGSCSLWCVCGASAVRLCIVVVVEDIVEDVIVCSAPAVPLRYAGCTPAASLWYNGCLQRDSCRLVAVKVGVVVAVCSAIAVDWLR